MSNAIFNTEDIVVLAPELIDEVKEKAKLAPLRRYRYCFHHDPSESVNEMLIALCGNSYIRPHRHVHEKSESYHLIEGLMAVFIFDDKGAIERRIDLGEPGSGLPFMYHLSRGRWHAPVPLSDPVVFHETFGGSFDSSLDVEYAEWAPEAGSESACNAFVSELLKRCPNPR